MSVGPDQDLCYPHAKQGLWGRCSSCGDSVAWAIMVRSDGTIGKPAPLVLAEYTTHVANVAVKIGKKTNVLYARVVEPGDDEALWVSHFANCPNASNHRKKKSSGKAKE